MKVLDVHEIEQVSGAAPLYQRDVCMGGAAYFMTIAGGFLLAAALTGPAVPATATIATGAAIFGSLAFAGIAASNWGLCPSRGGDGGVGGWVSGYDLIINEV